MTGDSDRSLHQQTVREPTPVAAEAAAPTFDVSVQGEARDHDRSEARVPRDVERAAEPPPFVEPKVVAPKLDAGPAVQPARDEEQRPVEAARPKRPPIDVPPIAQTLPPGSGLEIVETRFKPAPLPEAEPVQAGPRRVRPPRVAIPEEPLQIVETRKDEQPPAG